MPHKHGVYDTDPYFVLKKQTRTLTNKSTTPTKVMQFDHNCERITLELPRIIDGHDMTLCNSVQVHYINIDASNKDVQKFGVYEVTDLQAAKDDESIAICSWLISQNATQYIGPLYFVFSFRCLDENGEITYRLNTARYEELAVSTGIDNGEYIAEEYADILAQWETRIEALEQGGGSSYAPANADTLDLFSTLEQSGENVPTPAFDGVGLWTTEHGAVVTGIEQNADIGKTVIKTRKYPLFDMDIEETTISTPTRISHLKNDEEYITEKSLDSIKKELGNINGVVAISPTFSKGGISTDGSKSKAHANINVGGGKKLYVKNGNTSTYAFALYERTANDEAAVSVPSWNTSEEQTVVTNENTAFVVLVVKRADNAQIPEAEYTTISECFIVEYSTESYDDRINANAEQIEQLKNEIAEKQSDDLGTLMLYPNGFISRIAPNIYCKGFGTFTTDIDIESLKISGGVTVWIATDGDDANEGTETAPKKTLAEAFAVSGCTTVMIKEGTYLIGEHFTASQIIGKRNLIGIGTVVFDATDNAGFLQAKTSAYIENIEFIGGNTCFKAVMSDTDTLCMFKCKMYGAISSNALTVLGGNSYIIECEASASVLDGFNYHANTTNNSIPCVLEWNCFTHSCGDGSNPSSNGSTIHDGASIIRIGGEYMMCHGGVIADQGVNETTPSYSLNYGVYSMMSTVETEGYEHFNASFWAQKNCEMWLYMCRASDSTYDISSLENSRVYSMSMLSANMWNEANYTDESSTITMR